MDVHHTTMLTASESNQDNNTDSTETQSIRMKTRFHDNYTKISSTESSDQPNRGFFKTFKDFVNFMNFTYFTTL